MHGSFGLNQVTCSGRTFYGTPPHMASLTLRQQVLSPDVETYRAPWPPGPPPLSVTSGSSRRQSAAPTNSREAKQSHRQYGLQVRVERRAAMSDDDERRWRQGAAARPSTDQTGWRVRGSIQV